MNGTRQRDWSVFPVWITDAPTMEYAKVRALDGALGIGRRVQVQRGQREWLSGRVVEHPEGLDGHGGGTVWITIDAKM
jgi:hypothetical protein